MSTRRSFIASILAAPLALVAHSTASKEQHAILLARSTEPLGYGPSPLGTPMEVSRHCDVVGTFEDAPAGEVYDARDLFARWVEAQEVPPHPYWIIY